VPTLEERLKAAKPEPPRLPEGFAARVMDEIQARHLAIRPAPQRYRAWWLAAAVAAVLAAMALTNAFVFELRSNGSLELLEFGSRFLTGFLARVPYDLLAAAAALAALSGLLMRRGRIVHTRVAWVLLVTYGVTGIGGLALAGSGVNEELQTQVYAERLDWPGLHWFYRQRAQFQAPPAHFRFGLVTQVHDGSVVLLSPMGDEVTVDLPTGFRAQVGDHVRLGGRALDGRFQADDAQLCQPGRGNRYFMLGMRMGHGMGPGGMGPPGMRRGPFAPDSPPPGPAPFGPRGPGGGMGRGPGPHGGPPMGAPGPTDR
jgi:hypothetical protein